MISKRTATCCCGRLAVEASGEPALNVICHCADCRKRTGSAFGWSAYYPDSSLKLTRGEPRTYQPDGEDILPRQFCPDCASTLLWRDHRVPGHVGISAGSLQPPVDSPSLSNQDGDRQSWVALPDDCAARA